MIGPISKYGLPGQISLKSSFLLVQLSITSHESPFEWKYGLVTYEIHKQK